MNPVWIVLVMGVIEIPFSAQTGLSRLQLIVEVMQGAG